MRLYTIMDLGARIALDLWWSSWQAWLPQAQCTRCGGQHPLSQCKWPVAKEHGDADQA
jgi:hypothetical protein